MKTLPTDWQLSRLSLPSRAPTDWIPAVVPGAVQLDWARAQAWPALHHGQNVRAYAGLEDSAWLYRTTIPALPKEAAGQELLFVCGGVDHQAELRIAGKTIGHANGMEEGWELDVSPYAGASLEILIQPAPKRWPVPADRSQASMTTKPAVSYGWDWHPRLIPLGLLGPIGFFPRAAARVTAMDITYTLAEDLSSVCVRVEAEGTIAAGPLTWRLLDPEGREVLNGQAGSEAILQNPRLWWTHDHGEPVLYTLEVRPESGGDEWRERVGFRRVRLVMPPGGWEHPQAFPKSRSYPPITLELNGRPVFAKGSNWVNPEIFPGLIEAETYRPLLTLARDAHFNLLRCWGGAAAPRAAFFEQCDELGLLVWQEFPLACNLYPDAPAYLQELEKHAHALIRRLRRHPSLGMWCGGNELFNGWSRMTDQSLPLRLLNRLCLELDPATPFLPTSPLEGMGHGDYRFLDENGRDVFGIFQEAKYTAYTEFGCPGPSSVECLETIIPAEELWPPRPGGSWEEHHAFGAWDMNRNTWLCVDTIEHYFGPSESLAELVPRGEWLQAEGYRSIYEEARRQWPACSMALNWCYNEPWPSAANNNILTWPATPKPAYTAIQEACRPTMASARIPRFQWIPGEDFHAELWMLNDSPDGQPGGELIAALEWHGDRVELLRWPFPSLTTQSHRRGPSVHFPLPDHATLGEFTLVLTVADQPSWNSRYRLSLAPARLNAESGTRAMNV